jgi:hypothetical protein
MNAEMIIETDEFLSALDKLKPQRKTKTTLAEEMIIALYKDEAVFCVQGIQTSCIVENAKWNGYITVNAATVLSFLKSKPLNKTVKLTVNQNIFQIERLKIPCKTMQSPEWVTAISVDSLLHFDNQKSKVTQLLFCPKCGKKRGERFILPKNTQLSLDDEPPPKYPISRKCNACLHKWLEFDDLI